MTEATRGHRLRAAFLLAVLAACSGTGPGEDVDATQRIAFEVLTPDNPSAARLAAVHRDGTGYVILEEVPSGFAEPPVATPDGASILYAIYTESGEGWRLLPSEGGPSVAFPVPPDVYSPVWSPDGRSIAWMHVVVGRSRLGVAALGSIRITDLTPSDYNIDQYPTWAPDNDRLAVKRQYDLTWDLYVASRTSSVQPLVVGAGPVFEPDWSLARNKIAFVRPYAAAPANGIYVVDPDGSNVRQLVSGSYDGAVWWSPDGSTIAFWGWINGVEAQSITMVDVATGGVRSLPLPAGIYPAHRPWSSDGSQFLLSNQQGMITPGVVYTLALDGTLTRVSPDSVSAVFPVWIR